MSFKLLEIGRDALRRVRIGRCALVAAAVCVATAPSPSWADKTISANTILTEDTDWSDQGTVTIADGVTLDLNGHALTVAAINGAGSIVDSAAAALAGYERLEYLEAKQTGASTGAPGGAQAQFIDTGYRHNAKTDVDIRMAYTAVNSYRVVYGARNTGNNDTQFGVWVNGGKFMRQTCQKSASTPSSGYAATVDTVYDIRISKSGANTVKLKDSATVLYDLADGNKTDGNNVTGNDYLFSMNQSNSSTTQGSWPCACKVWFCKISEEGVLKRNFVPVLRKSDNAKGMLDLVENKFYTKKTTESAAFEGPIAPHGLRLTPSGNGAASDFSGLTVGEGVVLAFTGQYALPADLDATKFASVEIADGATLDLNGHNLVTAGLTGGGIVTDNANPYYTIFNDASANAYIQLEYLASGTSIGNYNHANEYIDTGYQHNTKTVVDMKVQVLKTTTDWYCYYGARNGTANAFAGWIYRDNHYKGVTADGSTSTPYPKNVPYLAHMEFGGTCTFGNASDTSTYLTYTSGAGGSSGRNDFMFALNQGSGNQFGFNGRIYYCTVKEKTDEAGVYTIKRDFVAAKRLSDGVLGMLDKENGVFYTNKGGGAFIAGDYAVNAEAAEFGSSGVLRIAVPAETTLALDDMPLIVGDIKVIKEGAGVLTYNEATSSQKYFLGGLEVAAGTLSMTQTAVFLAGTPIVATAGGTIEIAVADGASYANDFTLAGGTLKVIASGTSATTTATIAGTLALATGAADAQPVVSIDMTDCSSATFQLNTTALNVGSGVTAAPGFVSFADPTAYEASIEGGTAIKVESLTSPRTAVWTGLGEAGNFDDPGNWSCSNKYGVALANTTLPDNTTLTFRLARDADWTSKGAIALGEGATLDLNGQELIVANSVSGGAIIDTSCQSSGIYYGENGDVCLEATWLHSTSAGKQFIDTGYCHNPRTVVDMKVEYNPSLDGSGKWYSYFGGGGRNGSGSAGENYALGGWMNKQYFWKSGGTSPEGTFGIAAANNTPFTVHLDKSGACKINGTTRFNGNGKDWGATTPVTAYIFGHHNLNGTLYDNPYVGVRVYYCRISEGETVIRDFVPAMRITDRKRGMFDRKNNKFYVNGNSASTADFNIGTLAYSATGGGGELHITVEEGETHSLANTAKIAGNVKIVKDGLGTLVAPTTGQYFTGGIEVRAGTLSMGGALAYGGAINAASGTTVSVPKSVGSAGTSVINITGGTLEVANCGTSVVTGTVTLGGNAISVAGSFAPVSGTAAHTITLVDGATLDFTQWTGEFPVAYPTLAYAPDANIILKLEPASTALTALARSKDAETGKRNGYLFSWVSPPTDVTFSSDAATGARFRVVPDENGLRMSFKAGLSIIIR